MVHWPWVVFAFIMGGCIGFFVTALCVANGRSETDDDIRRAFADNEHRDDDHVHYCGVDSDAQMR